MRKIHIAGVALFVAAVLGFGFYQFYTLRSTDSQGPGISMDTDTITVSSAAGEEELLAGVKAVDKKDGDVSDTLLVESMSNFLEKGRRTITIAAFDSDNHVSKVTRQVIYSDYQSPTFSLEKPLRFPKNTDDILEGVEATDILDGNLTSNIKISSDYVVAVDEPGEYPVKLLVANSAADVAELPVTVTIYEQSEENKRPKIALSQYILYIPVGSTISPWDLVESVTIGNTKYLRQEDGSLRPETESGKTQTEVITKEQVTMTHAIDYATPGVYEVTYETNIQGQEPGSVRLIVVVRERSNP